MSMWWKTPTETRLSDLMKARVADTVREKGAAREELFQSLRQCERDQTELKIHRLNQEMRK